MAPRFQDQRARARFEGVLTTAPELYWSWTCYTDLGICFVMNVGVVKRCTLEPRLLGFASSRPHAVALWKGMRDKSSQSWRGELRERGEAQFTAWHCLAGILGGGSRCDKIEGVSVGKQARCCIMALRLCRCVDMGCMRGQPARCRARSCA